MYLLQKTAIKKMKSCTTKLKLECLILYCDFVKNTLKHQN